jgi:hypothetical protein
MLCQHSVFLCFALMSEQTVIFSLYVTKTLFFDKRKVVSLLCAMNRIFKWLTLIFFFKTVPCLKRLVAGSSSRRPWFNARPIHVRFEVDKAELWQAEGQVHCQADPSEICDGQNSVVTGLLQIHRFTPVSIFSPMLHTYLHLYAAFIRRTNRRMLGTF